MGTREAVLSGEEVAARLVATPVGHAHSSPRLVCPTGAARGGACPPLPAHTNAAPTTFDGLTCAGQPVYDGILINRAEATTTPPAARTPWHEEGHMPVRASAAGAPPAPPCSAWRRGAHRRPVRARRPARRVRAAHGEGHHLAPALRWHSPRRSHLRARPLDDPCAPGLDLARGGGIMSQGILFAVGEKYVLDGVAYRI